jgi:hypothetical protein
LTLAYKSWVRCPFKETIMVEEIKAKLVEIGIRMENLRGYL